MAQARVVNMGRGPGRGPALEKPKNPKETIGRLAKYLMEYKGQMLLVVLGICGSSGASVASTYFLKPIINDYIVPFIGRENPDLSAFVSMLCLMAVVYLIGVGSGYLYKRLMVNIATGSMRKIRTDLFTHMQKLPIKYFDTHTHGELMSRYTNDIETITEIMNNGLASLVSGALTFVGVVAMMIITSPLLFLVTIFCLGLMLAVVMTVGKRSRYFFAEQQRDIGVVNGYIEEMIEGQKVIKVFNHEEKAREGFAQRNEAYRRSATAAQSFAGAIMPAMGNISHINYALTCCTGALLSIYMGLDLGSLVMYLQYVRQVSQPVGMISQQINNVLAAIAGAERIFEVMEEASETDEGKTTLVNVRKGPDGALEETAERGGGWAWKQPDGSLVPLRGDVRFHDVVFSYVPGKTILHGISLYAKPGQKIAFVGSTGAGKTTITNLINRFYEIESGLITYDGIDVRDISKDSLRRSLGIVLQDTHLFTGTIADNIRYGKLDATDEEVRAAARLASADTFIRHLPKGYDTWITDDGGNLSQGERQLLAIARAAVADPPVLILDEATSSIDTRTEKLIEKGMDGLMQGRTVFVIAHRLSTVRNAKAIMVLEQGEIIERGDHNDLIVQGGKYYQLYTGQAELS